MFSEKFSEQLDNEEEREKFEYDEEGSEEDDKVPDYYPKESLVSDSEFRRKMDSTDAFIRKHNRENVQLDEEDKSDMYPVDKDIEKKQFQPRNTFEKILVRVDKKENNIKKLDQGLSFEQK